MSRKGSCPVLEAGGPGPPPPPRLLPAQRVCSEQLCPCCGSLFCGLLLCSLYMRLSLARVCMYKEVGCH